MNQDNVVPLKENVQHFIEKLRQERDELKLQMHLAKAETLEEWEQLEKKWTHVQNKLSSAGDAAGDASKDVSAAAEILGAELKKGYQRIKRAIATDL